MNRVNSAIFSSALSLLALFSCKTDFVASTRGNLNPVAIHSPTSSPSPSSSPTPIPFPSIAFVSGSFELGDLIPPLDGSHFVRKAAFKSSSFSKGGFYNLRGLEGRTLRYYSEVEDRFLTPGFEVWNWDKRFKLEKVSDAGIANLTVKYRDFKGQVGFEGKPLSGLSLTRLSKVNDFFILRQEISIGLGLIDGQKKAIFSHELGHAEGLGHSEMDGRDGRSASIMYPIVYEFWTLSDYDKLTFEMLQGKAPDFNLIFQQDLPGLGLPDFSFSTSSVGVRGQGFEKAMQFEMLQLD